MADSIGRTRLSDTVNRLLQCPICLDTLKKPRSLSCNHSYCKKCLADHLKTKYLNKDKVLQVPPTPISIACPICGAVNKPFNSLDEIGTSHIINELLEAHEKECSTEQEVLFPCCICKNTTNVQCLRCKFMFCFSCIKDEIGKKCLGLHNEIMSITQSNKKHFFVKLQSLDTGYDCKNHSAPLNLFCTICKEAICMDCFLTAHRDHLTRPVSYARFEANDVADNLRSARNENKARGGHLQQQAMEMLKILRVDEERINYKLEKEEMKITGLISSIFKSAKSHYTGFARRYRRLIQDSMHCMENQNNNQEFVVYNENKMTDLELACLVNDLIVVMKEEEKVKENLEESAQLLEGCRFQRNLELCVNEEAKFNAILDIFEHFQIVTGIDGKCTTNDFTHITDNFDFQSYEKGEYLDPVKPIKISKLLNEFTVEQQAQDFNSLLDSSSPKERSPRETEQKAMNDQKGCCNRFSWIQEEDGVESSPFSFGIFQ